MSPKMSIQRHKKSRKRRLRDSAASASGGRRSQPPSSRPAGGGVSSGSEQPPAPVIDAIAPALAGHLSVERSETTAVRTSGSQTEIDLSPSRAANAPEESEAPSDRTPVPDPGIASVAMTPSSPSAEESDVSSARASRPEPCSDPVTSSLAASPSTEGSGTAAGGALGRGTSSDAAAIFDDPSHLDIAFFDDAPQLPWGEDPAAPSAHFLAVAAGRRARLTKYVRAAVTFSVALCVAALVKAVATRDPDQALPSHSHPSAVSPWVGHALDQAASAGRASVPGTTGPENAGLAGAGLAGDRRDSRGSRQSGTDSPP